mmetsp:Transcript_6261/g.14839  ORF Transcript_6261/g.14839 Transcript_6261/m.14839 type:complete len:201 (-) Transcript_6261:418-1020(-)
MDHQLRLSDDERSRLLQLQVSEGPGGGKKPLAVLFANPVCAAGRRDDDATCLLNASRLVGSLRLVILGQADRLAPTEEHGPAVPAVCHEEFCAATGFAAFNEGPCGPPFVLKAMGQECHKTRGAIVQVQVACFLKVLGVRLHKGVATCDFDQLLLLAGSQGIDASELLRQTQVALADQLGKALPHEVHAVLPAMSIEDSS